MSATNPRIIKLEEGWENEIKAKVRDQRLFCVVLLLLSKIAAGNPCNTIFSFSANILSFAFAMFFTYVDGVRNE